MELSAAEERKILDGLKTFIDVFARSFAEQYAKHDSEIQKPAPKRKAERELEKITPPPAASRSIRPAGIPHLIPVTKWNEHHEFPSVSSLRWLIFNAEKTGFDKVIRRVGRRVLIDEAAFFAWVGGGITPTR